MNRVLQWKLVAGFVLVFLAGAVTGAFVGVAQMRHQFLRSPHRAFLKDRMVERLRTQLKLTPEQVEKISPIIDKTTAELETIRTETGRRVQETMAQAHREMAGNLTPEQDAKLKEIERRHGHGRMFPERSAPPPPEDRQE